MTSSSRFLLFAALVFGISNVTNSPEAVAQGQAPVGPSVRTVLYANSYPSGVAPTGVWSPDGRLLTYLSGDSQTGQPGDLIQVDAVSGHTSVLATAQQLSALGSDQISEKDQDHRSRYAMSSFLWADDSKHLLLDLGGKLWLYDIAAGTGTLVVDTGAGSGDDPKFSPDAKSVSYLRNHNLYVHPVSDGAAKETALTSDTVPTMLNGEVDWVYLEELNVRSDYFWAPDSSAIAYLQMDEAKVPEYPIVDFIPTHATIDHQRYPQPGDANPAVRVGVVPALGGATHWVTLPFSQNNDYIPRFGWVDAHTLYIEVLRRDQKSRSLFLVDARTGEAREVYTDADPKYLGDDYEVTLLPRGRFVTTSWRDGHTHLYLYKFDEKHPLSGPAKLVRQISSGDFDVLSIEGFDPKSEAFFYQSNQGNPVEAQLWRAKLDGSVPVRVSQEKGSHDTALSPDHQHYSDFYSTASMPPVGRVCAIALADSCKPFWRSNPVPEASGVSRSIVTFTAADGKTRLYGTLTMPSGKLAAGSVPIILNPYGGPLSTPGVTDSWTSPLFDELLAQHGFAVLSVDNRGSGGRGRDFQQIAQFNFGPPQLADQLAALDQTLARNPQVDATRVGWWGWSWGGTFTLYAMTHTDRIKAGAAVAPVTDFRDYDSIYTERYLGLPAEHADAYKAASVTTSAASLKGRVLIALGTGDDNVHMANTVQFLEPLIEAGIPYDLQIFPRKTHAIGGLTARNELFERILFHFETYLK
jgi:dipeptidyl-peptidase-4